MNTRDVVIEHRKKNPCATLQELGDKAGVTRERARQILNIAGLPTRAFKQRYLCRNCGKELPLEKHRIYCSRECYWDYRRRFSYIEVVCDGCGRLCKKNRSQLIHHLNRPFSSNGKKQEKIFCSQECKGKYVGTNYGFASHRKNIYSVNKNEISDKA